MESLYHTIEPLFDEKSKVLILGSFPSPKSREAGFFYGHPQNRFWRVMEVITDNPPLDGIESKTAFLKKHHIAMWDVCRSCIITGASDTSIKNAEPNDIGMILKNADIKNIYTTGKKAFSLYQKLVYPMVGRKAICLPSTSPANCACNFEKLVEAYSVILSDI